MIGFPTNRQNSKIVQHFIEFYVAIFSQDNGKVYFTSLTTMSKCTKIKFRAYTKLSGRNIKSVGIIQTGVKNLWNVSISLLW
jgi:hypothetical protein